MDAKNCSIPFFVVDRPMSLELLRYCEIDKQEGVFGLMGHANTSKRFQDLFREFNADNVIKSADSGVFSKNGCKLDYVNLFSTYERMGVEYGVMIDFLKDKDKTIESAKKAIEIYNKETYSFKLVGVTQGNTSEEYLECYNELKSIGLDHIAIGGLLKKNVNSARYVRVKDEEFLKEVLEKIRSNYKKDWLFVLGCYHPKRHILFKEFNVFGGDYKGWILNYKTPEMWVEELNRELREFETGVENIELDNLLNKKEKINQELKKMRGDKELRQKKEKEKLELDKKILKLREKIAVAIGNEYYSKLQTLEKILYTDKETKRDYRFKQIRAYLNNNVFSLFRDYLLIISCSQRKASIYNPAPAIELYDGPAYRIIRKMKQEGSFTRNTHILVISAKYGLLGPYDLIEKYDQKMTEKRAEELKQEINRELNKFLSNKRFKEIFINVGKNYCLPLEKCKFKIPLRYATGKIGEKLSQTKEWINSR